MTIERACRHLTSDVRACSDVRAIIFECTGAEGEKCGARIAVPLKTKLTTGDRTDPLDKCPAGHSWAPSLIVAFNALKGDMGKGSGYSILLEFEEAMPTEP